MFSKRTPDFPAHQSTNMLFIALLASVFAFTSAARQDKNHHAHGSSNKCSKQLAGIVFQPQNTWGQYLKSISRELLSWTELPSAIQTSTIQSFQTKYGVTVTVTDAFGFQTTYDSTGASTPALTSLYYSDMAQAVLNLGAYNNDNTDYRYTFLSWADNGEVNEITIVRPNI